MNITPFKSNQTPKRVSMLITQEISNENVKKHSDFVDKFRDIIPSKRMAD